ncbi:TIGR04222 domain-containing membrane protein [Blastococcus sp. SYSU D00813]
MTAVPGLDVYEAAWLAGGVPRVVETAVARLLEDGRVRASGGLLATVDATRTSPVEGAVLDAVGTRGHRPLDTVAWRAAADDRVRAIGRGLADRGLLRPSSRWRRAGVRPTRAGRELLRRAAAVAPADGDATAWCVALHGPGRLPDPALRRALTERPPAPASVPEPDVRALREHRRALTTEPPEALAWRTVPTDGGAP